ncbi:MAG TPA: response regulator [Bacteroidia bacterium]|jgi:CheY-like chemotaxis protein|nr:response regulator [Bacteroidia bacterium]
MKTHETPLNILLADDDPDDRLFFEKALKEIPIHSHLTSVNNGEELMKYLTTNTEHLPDVVFLDLSMPRKTGYECLIEIKEDEKLKSIPVIMFSTSFTHGIGLEESLISTLSKMGAQNYIRKPGDFEKLKQVIQDALTKLIEKENLTI